MAVDIREGVQGLVTINAWGVGSFSLQCFCKYVLAHYKKLETGLWARNSCAAWYPVFPCFPAFLCILSSNKQAGKIAPQYLSSTKAGQLGCSSGWNVLCTRVFMKCGSSFGGQDIERHGKFWSDLLCLYHQLKFQKCIIKGNWWL